jgi:general secretion pathway protein H
MPTLATGISGSNHSRPVRSPTGFTLVEIMIVVFIIGLFTAVSIITFGGDSRDTELDKEAERLEALFAYAREHAELQTRDYGFLIDRREYQFVVFDPMSNQWRVPQEDEALRARPLPEGLIPSLVLEGRTVVLDSRKPKIASLKPQIMFFANGDLTSFELSLEREGNPDDRARLYSDEQSNLRLLLPGETEPSGGPVRTAARP